MTTPELDELLAGADFALDTSEEAMRWAPPPASGYQVTYTLNGLPHVDLATSYRAAQQIAARARLNGAADVTITLTGPEEATA